MEYIVYILLFAIVTVIIFLWGMFKERNKSKDLLSLLYVKCEKAILKELKKNKTLTRKDIEDKLVNVKSTLFYSRDKLIVNEPSHVAKVLIGKLLREGTISKTVNGYTLK